MTQKARLGASVACALLMTACGGGGTRTTADANGNAAANNPLLNSDTRPQPMTVTGCLTASADRFVLTALDRKAATPTTETYQLKGAQDAELQKYVNREVRVVGEADAAKVADVRDLPSTTVGTGGTSAEVKTQEATRFEVRTLTVSSVTPTGDPCPAAAPGSTQGR